MTSTRPPTRRTKIRWWPLISIVAVAAVAIVWFQLHAETNQQQANMNSMGVGVLAAGLAGVWFFLFSRVPGLWKCGGAALLALLIVAGEAGFRLRGVTGDLIPIFEWRWASAAPLPDPEVEPESTTPPVAGLADYPQFMGPARTGVLSGPRLARDWVTTPPVELWRRPVGRAWSGFAVSGRRAVTQEQHGDDESVICYDVVTGAVLWVHADRARFDTVVAGTGPRATPTIRGERVFAQGATGILNCLDLGSGDVVWSRDLRADNAAELPVYGFAASPLIVGDRVVVEAGGVEGRSLVAYDSATGGVVWAGGSERAQWSSPVRAAFAGIDQVLIFNASVTGHDAATGEVLWQYPWRGGHPHVSCPVVVAGDRLLVSSGYGTGAQLLQIDADESGAFSATKIWKARTPKAKFTNLIVHDGFIYGLDDGILSCVDLATGRRKWKRGRYGHGQTILVADLLLVSTEGGEVVLVDAVPDKAREVARLAVFDGKTWNPPALAGEYLVLRNDVEAACYRLPVAN